MHQALYRKWRPLTFNDVYGQEHITSVLKYEVANGKTSHAYLFSGSRGVGKTTCAKILAKAVNCEHPVNGEPCGKCQSCLAIESGSATDVLEMDAASNNGVDNIRDIRDEVAFAPSLLKYRVYIVDEVHMLSSSAFNALLKTLEEPPSYVIFILATTEQHKLPATIVSRCQRFEFKRITTERLTARIDLIAKEEKIDITPDAAHLIARLAQGGMRDAISLLELCAGNNTEITPELVNATVGSTGRERTLKIARAVAEKDYDAMFGCIDELTASSKNISVFWGELMSFWRDMLICKTAKDSAKYLDLTDTESKELNSCADQFTRETLIWQYRLLDDAMAKLTRSATTARMTAELTLIRICDEKLDDRTDALLSRISKLEERLKSGIAFKESVAEKSAEKPQPQKKPTEKPKVKPEAVVITDKPETNAQTENPTVNEVSSAKPSVTPAPTAKGRTLRRLRVWQEVLEEISVSDILLWVDLNETGAFTDEHGNTVVVFDNRFLLERANKPQIIQKIAELIRNETGKETNVTFELLESTEKEDTVIDEILDNAE